MIPCVTNNLQGLQFFQATADQRFALGEDLFVATHLPMRLWQRRAQGRRELSEEQVLATLTASTGVGPGNRVHVLYGAAGSGKSELIRWLEVQIKRRQPERYRFLVRIPRTDLDPARSVQRILSTFGATMPDATLSRWDDLKAKPVALANQLIWAALAAMYARDEEILPLSYRLRPIVEGNLRASFAGASDSEDGTALHLITREQLEQAAAACALPLPVLFEQFRARLQAELEHVMLGGVQMVPSLRQISRRVRHESGVRPILLVDDLVQSLNVYATDLLDYLITLEEGEWDVVVGITPASLEADKTGRTLLQRIRELDTVDDRVVRFELSDTSGNESSFLSEENCDEYLVPYLRAYKQAADFHCDVSCPHRSQCVALQFDTRPDADLSPFNAPFLHRLYRGLPDGKGRARYLLMHVQELLQTLATEGTLQAEGMLQMDLHVDHPVPAMRTVMRAYLPPSTATGEQVTVPPALAAAYGLPSNSTVTVYPLAATPVAPLFEAAPATRPDPILAAISVWLEGGQPNAELLKPLRLGAARFVRDTVDPGLLAGHLYAQSAGVLRWSENRDGTSLPLAIEGLDEYEGIRIPRAIGPAAFDVALYATVSGPHREALCARLTSSSVVVAMLFAAEEQRRRWQTELNTALGLPLEEMAFHLQRVLMLFDATTPGHEDRPLPAQHRLPARDITALWEDCFRIRDHMYDALTLEHLAQTQLAESVTEILKVVPERIPSAYRLREARLGDTLGQVQGELRRLQDQLQQQTATLGEMDRVIHTAALLLDAACIDNFERIARQIDITLASDGAAECRVPHLTADLAPEIRACKALVSEARDGDAWQAVLPLRSALASNWYREVRAWLETLDRLHERLNQTFRQLGPDSADAPEVSGDHATKPIALLRHCLWLAQQTCKVKDRQHVERHAVALWRRQRLFTLVQLLARGFAVSEAARESLLRAQSELRGRIDTLLDPEWCRQPLQFACTWWRQYFLQLASLRPRLAPAAHGYANLIELWCSEGLSEQNRHDWQAALSFARRTGFRDLPLRVLAASPAVPALLRPWLGQLAANLGGLPYDSLSPDLAAALQGYLPELAANLSIQVGPPGQSSS